MIVKICGITNIDDAAAAVDAGADMLGFILYPPSPRAIRAVAVRDIVADLRSRTVYGRPLKPTYFVGVFVNETPAVIQRVLGETRLDFAQLSGDEPIETLAALKLDAFKAVRNADDARRFSHAAARLAGFGQRDFLPDVLLEADHPTLYGGTGHRADASLARDIARDHRTLLAGGLTPDNVADAIKAARPWGVDVASGVEARKGKKDHGKVSAFVANAKAALASGTAPA
jgi:phosphoribosylanthranilate isomerase